MLKKVLCLYPIMISALCFAQDIQVNRENKTIAVTADELVSADAEVAVLAIGYHNYALTQDAAFRTNVRAAEEIVKTLLDAKVPIENIETDKLKLGPAEANQLWTEQMKKERAFEAEQSWHVNVPVALAQTVVGFAVKAGANEVDDVEWNVIDPVGLQAKASGAALAKARSIAEQMARGLGTKLGALVYASNRAPIAKVWRGMTVNTMASVSGALGEKEPKLRLFPEKVKSDATVYAVFAIE